MLDAYVVRRPIFTMDKEVFGYSLCYKNALSPSLDSLEHSPLDEAVVTATFDGLDHHDIFGTYLSFFNFQDYLLKEKYGERLKPESTVFSFLHDRFKDEAHVKQIQNLRSLGYTTMMEVSAPEQLQSPMIDLFDIIAVNLETEDKKMEARLCVMAKDHKKVLMGQNVQDSAAFMRARRLMCDLFTGDFYKKFQPGTAVPILYPSHLSFLKMMQLQDKSEPEFKDYLDILDNDPSIAYRLLLHVNTVEYYRGKEIKSIRAAAITLGLEPLKEWIYLACFQSANYRQNDEIVRLSLIRAKFLELLAPFVPAIGKISDQLHLMGMLSLIDSIMNISMEKALEHLHIDEDIQDALSHRIGRLGMLLDLVDVYENAEWEKVSEIEARLKLERGSIIRSYLLALRYVNELWDSVSAKPE